MYTLFSILFRNKDKIELDSSSPSSKENEEKVCLEYNEELEKLCEELQATLDGLVRHKDAGHLWSLSLNPMDVFGVCLTIGHHFLLLSLL